MFTQRHNKANITLSVTTAHWHWIFGKAPRQYSSHQTGGSHSGDIKGSATLCQWACGSCVSKEHTAFILKGQRSSRPRKMANDSQLFFLNCLVLQTTVRMILQDTENQSPNHTVSYPSSTLALHIIMQHDSRKLAEVVFSAIVSASPSYDT